MRSGKYRKGLVVLVMVMIVAAPLFAGGGSEVPKWLNTSEPLVITNIIADAGVTAALLPDVTKGSKAVGELAGKVIPIVNIDIHGVNGSDIFAFGPGGFNGQEPYVVVVIPISYVLKQAKGLIKEVKQLAYYDPGKNQWFPLAGSSDVAEWERTANYFWFRLRSWPLDDRLIGCE